MALSDYSYQLVWTRNLLSKIRFNVLTPHIYNNNLGSLFWKSNTRDLIENEQVKPYNIDGKKNPADILTKNLSQVLFSYFCLSLSLEIL